MGYGHLLERQRVVDAARTALSEMECSLCRVFVMSNCRDEAECAPLSRGMLGVWGEGGARKGNAVLPTGGETGVSVCEVSVKPGFAPSPPPRWDMCVGVAGRAAAVPHLSPAGGVRCSISNSAIGSCTRMSGARDIGVALAPPLPSSAHARSPPRRWAHLASSIPTLTRYVPPGEELATEGPRLVVEQTIASRARVFYGSGRSAVSQLIHRRRQLVRGAGAERQPRYI